MGQGELPRSPFQCPRLCDKSVLRTTLTYRVLVCGRLNSRLLVPSLRLVPSGPAQALFKMAPGNFVCGSIRLWPPSMAPRPCHSLFGSPMSAALNPSRLNSARAEITSGFLQKHDQHATIRLSTVRRHKHYNGCVCASTTASATILTIRRTEAIGVSTCTGFATPISTGPTVTPSELDTRSRL